MQEVDWATPKIVLIGEFFPLPDITGVCVGGKKRGGGGGGGGS